MCVPCTVACTHFSCARRGPGCDENTHLWLKQALLRSGCSLLYLSSPPCPSISWRRCLLSGRRDMVWLCVVQADVHHGSDISIQTAGQYLVVVFHYRRAVCLFFLVMLKPRTHFNTTQHFHKLLLAHSDDEAVLTSTCYLGFTQQITRCFPWADFRTINKPLKKLACRQHLKNNAGRIILSANF